MTKRICGRAAFGAGGGMDVHTQLLAKYLTAYTDQSFLVINKAGASGLIGHAYSASQATNDGYTLGVLSSNFWAASAQRAASKWSCKDVDPIGFYNSEPFGWVVLTAGPHGLEQASGARFNRVPFQGVKQAITNLLGGHFQPVLADRSGGSRGLDRSQSEYSPPASPGKRPSGDARAGLL